MMDNKIKVRLASIVEGNVMLCAHLVMMEFKIKAKQTLTVEDLVLLAVRKHSKLYREENEFKFIYEYVNTIRLIKKILL